MVHIMSAGIEPTFARPTHLSGWHIATGAQSASFSHESFENLGPSTAVACGSGVEASFGAFPAGGDEQTRTVPMDAATAARRKARMNTFGFTAVDRRFIQSPERRH